VSDLSGDELLRLPVRQRGILLGRPVDLLLDLGGARVVGLDILCGDGAHRFLPFAAASPRGAEISVESAFALLDDRDVEFYRQRARALKTLRGVPIDLDGLPTGTLADVVVGAYGAIEALVVAGPGGPRRVAFDRRVRVQQLQQRAG
jgi:hypothetical protein